MKVSELLEKLQVLMEEHGDLPVTYHQFGITMPVDVVEAFDSNGNSDGSISHIHIF